MTRKELKQLIAECVTELLNEEVNAEEVKAAIRQKFPNKGNQEQINWLAWMYLTQAGEQYALVNTERSKYEKYKDAIVQKLVSTNPNAFTRSFGIRDAVEKAISARQHAVYERKK